MTEKKPGRPRVKTDEERREYNRVNQANYQQRSRDKKALNAYVVERLQQELDSKEKQLWNQFLLNVSGLPENHKIYIELNSQEEPIRGDFEDLKQQILNKAEIRGISLSRR